MAIWLKIQADKFTKWNFSAHILKVKALQSTELKVALITWNESKKHTHTINVSCAMYFVGSCNFATHIQIFQMLNLQPLAQEETNRL